MSSRIGTLVVLALAVTTASAARSEDARFRQANELVRAGDYPKAIALYRELAVSGQESASLYWNWAQAAAARGAQGESLWALLRARELDPADRAVARDLERLREALNLDPAEVAPEALATVARFGRRFRLDLLVAVLLLLSLVARVVGRLLPRAHWARPAAWFAFLLGLALSGVLVAGTFSRPTGVVVSRGAPLLDAASPSAETVGALREGEVVPVLEAGGDWLRVEDNAGARGWAHLADVRRLDSPPAAARD